MILVLYCDEEMKENLHRFIFHRKGVFYIKDFFPQNNQQYAVVCEQICLV